MKVMFKNIEYSNFRSIGNTPVKINLNKDKTTLISGTNGAGKCVSSTTIVRIKNRKTGEIKEITIGDLYAQEKQGTLLNA